MMQQPTDAEYAAFEQWKAELAARETQATEPATPAPEPEPQPQDDAPAYAVNVARATLGYTSDVATHGIRRGQLRLLTRNVGDMAGGGALAKHVDDLPIPVWCQLINDYPNHAEHPQRDVDATTDCGSQCCAMAIYSARGVELPEGIVRDYISDCVGGLSQGLTTADDLVAYLRSPHVNMPGARAVQQPWPQVRDTIQEELTAHRLVLILGAWYAGTLHWELARGYDTLAGLRTNDPWAGRIYGTTWQDYANRINTGILVLTGETAHHG